MQSNAKTVQEYLKEIPEKRQDALSTVRDVILNNLPTGYVEVMNWGMITYEIPLKTFPGTYNKQPLMYAALASQKNHMAIYMSCVYSDENQLMKLQNAFAKMGIKPNMGKSCIRFKDVSKIPLTTIGELIGAYSVEDYIQNYNRCRK
ncbi:MAG: DUF1801 domain-containing protein [Candidatus Marinimicrobia bacterium]|nr:DUF1801 domain-containing protein [Candidatus Neomarinimicrobiota bacterium]MBL7009938.1 DUF1801 domain-containing protein [Candidatus Neomarinimicrobiota bacterium]MBL7029763.1 DUF1801 domain-containing protein [Candidatus Neomarinimicrobiota bacterium]